MERSYEDLAFSYSGAVSAMSMTGAPIKIPASKLPDEIEALREACRNGDVVCVEPECEDRRLVLAAGPILPTHFRHHAHNSHGGGGGPSESHRAAVLVIADWARRNGGLFCDVFTERRHAKSGRVPDVLVRDATGDRAIEIEYFNRGSSGSSVKVRDAAYRDSRTPCVWLMGHDSTHFGAPPGELDDPGNPVVSLDEHAREVLRRRGYLLALNPFTRVVGVFYPINATYDSARWAYGCELDDCTLDPVHVLMPAQGLDGLAPDPRIHLKPGTGSSQTSYESQASEAEDLQAGISVDLGTSKSARASDYAGIAGCAIPDDLNKVYALMNNLPVLLGLGLHLRALTQEHPGPVKPFEVQDWHIAIRIMLFADPALTEDRAAAVVGGKATKSAVEVWMRFLKEHDSASVPVAPTPYV